MLSLQMKMTAPQVNLLLVLTYCEARPTRWADGTETPGLPLETEMIGGSFIPTIKALERRGLIQHVDGRYYVVTDEGKAVASLIYNKAKAIVELAERKVPVEAEVRHG